MNENNNIEIERAALADLDCALHLDGEKLLNHRMGNVMWRSPEGQAGKGVGKPSEIFSFGLIVSASHPLRTTDSYSMLSL